MQPRRHEDTTPSPDGSTRARYNDSSELPLRRSVLDTLERCGARASARRGEAREKQEMSDLEHKAQAPQSVRCFVITVSDTRTDATDASGRAIVALLEAAGHFVSGRTIVKEDPELLRGTIERQLANPHVEGIITTGGTRITSRGTTY